MKISERTENYINTVKKQLEQIGVLEDVDIENLEFLKTQTEIYYRALDDLENNGLTYKDLKGKLQTNPAFSIQRSAIQNITSLLRELSISARQRRFLTKDEIINETDPMDEFIKKIQKERVEKRDNA